MLFLDDYYKIDCENKIKYDNLVRIELTDNSVKDNIFNASVILTDADPENPIYLVAGTPTFYTKNVKFCKEIGPDLYKISIEPFKPSRNDINRQRKYIENNNN